LGFYIHANAYYDTRFAVRTSKNTNTVNLKQTRSKNKSVRMACD